MGLGPCTINGVAYTVCSTLANLNQRRKLSLENPTQGALLGFVDEHNDVGWQKYNGLRFTGTRRSATGLTPHGNYTFSNCVGTATPGSFPQIAQRLHQPGQSRHGQGALRSGPHAPGEHHRRLPDTGARQQGAAHPRLELAGDGHLLARDRAQWINITTGADNALNGQLQQRPNKVSDDVYGAKTLNSYLNRAAFATPAARDVRQPRIPRR